MRLTRDAASLAGLWRTTEGNCNAYVNSPSISGGLCWKWHSNDQATASSTLVQQDSMTPASSYKLALLSTQA